MPTNVYQTSEGPILQLQIGQAFGSLIGDTILSSYSYGESLGTFYVTVKNTGDMNGVFRVEIWDRSVDPWVTKVITRDVPIAVGAEHAFKFGDITDPTVDGSTFDFYPAIGSGFDGSYNIEAKRREGFIFYSYVQTDTYIKTITLLITVTTTIQNSAIQDEQDTPITVAEFGQQIQVVGQLVVTATVVPVDTVATDKIWITGRPVGGTWADIANVGSDALGNFTSGLFDAPGESGTYEYQAKFIGETQQGLVLAPSTATIQLSLGIPNPIPIIIAIGGGLITLYLATR